MKRGAAGDARTWGTLAPRDLVLQSSHLCAHSRNPRASPHDHRGPHIYKAQSVFDALGIVIPSNHNARYARFAQTAIRNSLTLDTRRSSGITSNPLRKHVKCASTNFSRIQFSRVYSKNDDVQQQQLRTYLDAAPRGWHHFCLGGLSRLRRNLENLREFYKMLLRRNSVDNVALAGIPLEHLMIRKSQRSPSLRLRFGRSGPGMSAGVMTRPGNQAAFDDN